MKNKPIYSRPDVEMLRLDCAADVFVTSTGATNENFTIDDGIVDF